MAIYTTKIKNPATDEYEIKTYSVTTSGGYGYVYDDDDGKQVCVSLARTGETLRCWNDDNALRDLIRSEQRKRLRTWRNFR